MQVLGTPPPWAVAPVAPVAPSTPPPDPFQALGLDGPHSITRQFTGDAGLAVAPGTGGSLPVSGVFVAGVKDAAAVDGFLRGLAKLAGSDATWSDEVDGDAVIHTLHAPQFGGVAPAYTVLDGYLVVGTDATAVGSALDAHRGSTPGVSSNPVFRGSAAASATGSLLFVDVQGVVKAIRDNLGSADRADFDRNALPILRPMRVLTVTSRTTTRVQTSHMVLTVGG
jgi:hypothetical protein